ncbi:MAG: TetR/AcrR family transcriptional regulator [Proteobacteria bacterium]|nr:MAG: TetR/AcrR family transcriptional regulator [Pseudomonadota bacterium]
MLHKNFIRSLVVSENAPKQKRTRTKGKISADDIHPCKFTSKDKLLKAALDVFAKCGFSGSTTKNIAAQAGVNEALISRHYQSKAGLFLSVIEQKLDESPLEKEFCGQADLYAEFCVFADLFYSTMQDNKDLIRVLLGHAITDVDFAKEARAKVHQPFSKAFHCHLVTLQAEGKMLSDVDPLVVQKTIKKLTHATFQESCLMLVVDEETAQRDLKIALKILARGLTPSLKASE